MDDAVGGLHFGLDNAGSLTLIKPLRNLCHWAQTHVKEAGPRGWSLIDVTTSQDGKRSGSTNAVAVRASSEPRNPRKGIDIDNLRDFDAAATLTQTVRTNRKDPPRSRVSRVSPVSCLGLA